MDIVYKHVSLKNKQVSNEQLTWITHELTRKIYQRNSMKKIAIQDNNTAAWE